MNDPYTRRKLIGAILVIILLLFLLIGEAMRDRTLRRWAFAWLCVVAGGLGVIVTCLYLLLSPVLAHDHEHPELTEWMKTLKSGKGMCCDGFDALHLSEVDWETQNLEHSHVKVRVPKNGDDFQKAVRGETVETEWVDVPDEAIITEPNKAGATLVWPLYGYMGVSIRCFMLGSMT